MEVDEFDILRPVHLLNRSGTGRIQGCVRLLPSTGPTMLSETFPFLLDGQPAPRNDRIWESSRFALDVPTVAPKASGGLAAATYEPFAGMIEFGLSIELIEIVTVTDARMERILRRAGWPLRRVGKARPLGNTTAVAGTWRSRPMRSTASARRGASRDRRSGLRSFKRLPRFWKQTQSQHRCRLVRKAALLSQDLRCTSHIEYDRHFKPVKRSNSDRPWLRPIAGAFVEPPSC